ncbi:MAG: hypothetical protein PF436_12750 [Prolixibacteraceae bacterium]|jgi:hypothetical protein|nr:hypothetical protein [Prolixibacteraceae bacterium]
MDFNKIYNNTPDSIKLSFLEAITEQNQKLQAEFIAYAETKISKTDKLSYEKFTSIVNNIQADYQKQFEAVNLEDPDWDNYNPPHGGYIEEWEAYQIASEQEFEAILDEFRNDAINTIIEQCPEDLTAMLIGLYEATQDADVPDEVCSFNDVNEHLLSEHKNTLNAIIDKLKLSALTENKVATAFEMFLRYSNEEYPGNPHFVSHFEHLLISMAEKCSNANVLLDIFNKSGLEKEVLPELILVLNKLAGNKTEWLQSALQFYKNSAPVAMELLLYYFETDKAAFVTLARELFATDEHLWANFLQQYITPQLDNELFVKVFLKLFLRTHDMQYYHKIKDYLTETDFKQLLADVKWDEVLTVKILEIEERYADIKLMVEKSSNKWHFAELIEPILKIYPEFSFTQIKKMALNTVQTERGRSIYEKIVTWLTMTKQIPGFETESLMLIQQVYTHKPNLPALRGEMRDAGLV